jgi:hypothetical protein
VSKSNHTREDFFQVFGHIAVFFATLDLFVTLTILHLVRKDKRIKSIAMKDSTTLNQKLLILGRLQPDQVTDAAILGEVASLIPDALKVGEKRNRFTHDQWVFNPKTVTNGVISRCRIAGLSEWGIAVMKEDEVTIEQLQAFLNEIGALQIRFGQVFDRLNPLANPKQADPSS